MAHVALYRKWRPVTFDDVVEQQHIVTTLKNSVIKNTISHAYLFCGTRGTGKTTMAKIFSRAVNCLNPSRGNPCNECSVCKGILDNSIMDVVEIDAASNNGVDDVREIREAVMYVPAVARYKVYIIDEVHMLSTGAFNALLKTLEEPPQYVIFILATTEPQKIPATILSRCQRFDFKRISIAGIASRLKTIVIDAGFSADDSALNLIARLSQGGMRDAISLLDQCISLGKERITREDVAEISGLAASEAVNLLAGSIISRDIESALNCIKTSMDEGKDLLNICNQLIEWFRNLMLCKTGGEAEKLIELDEEELTVLRENAANIELDQIINIIKELSETEGKLKWSENQRILFEVALVKLCSGVPVKSKEQVSNTPEFLINETISRLEARIVQLEKKISSVNVNSQKTELKQSAKNISDADSIKKENKIDRLLTEEKDKELSPDTKGSINIGKVNTLKEWPQIINDIRARKKMKVYAYLLDTECILTDRNTALIIVSSDDGLKKTVLSRNESVEVIKESFLRVMGIDVAVKITDEQSISSQVGTGSDENTQEEKFLEDLKNFASKNNIDLTIKD
ncbi:MAG: DNA polymerase III subunit gamma/tau [Clostridiaceae bacterium]|nr:DNA polymerase III subunit gamma/tau [Clostridiaceae bacterium]